MSAEQGTAAWLQERAGFVTASRLVDVMAKVKTGEAAGRANYRAELVAQRLTGQVQEGFTNSAMAHGTEFEPFARASYEIKHGVIVEECGFIKHPEIEWTGASPDGLIDSDGLIEIKCPNTATHIDYLLKGVVPAKYQPQMLWQMACTGRQWCDFVSFDPRMPAELQLFVVRFNRDEARIAEAVAEVTAFLAEVQDTVAALERLIHLRRDPAERKAEIQAAKTTDLAEAM